MSNPTRRPPCRKPPDYPLCLLVVLVVVLTLFSFWVDAKVLGFFM